MKLSYEIKALEGGFFQFRCYGLNLVRPCCQYGGYGVLEVEPVVTQTLIASKELLDNISKSTTDDKTITEVRFHQTVLDKVIARSL